MAIVYPLKEWHLLRIVDDAYTSELIDNQTGFSSHLKNYKFDRSDISQLEFKNNLRSGDHVKKGDTLGFIHSFQIRNELTRLKNLKNAEEMNLMRNLAGEKPELIDQAYKQYELAQQQLYFEKKNYLRHKNLYNDSIISQAAYDRVENAMQTAELNVQIAFNYLVTLKSGSKPEEIEYIKQRIESFNREIQLLDEQLQNYYIITPIDGVIGFDVLLNGVISVINTSSFILKIPVQVKNIAYLPALSSIKFSNSIKRNHSDATFIGLDDRVTTMTNQQFAVAKAHVYGESARLHSGMAVKCRIYCDRITLYELFKRGVSLNF